jgi:hypothetical protein
MSDEHLTMFLVLFVLLLRIKVELFPALQVLVKTKVSRVLERASYSPFLEQETFSFSRLFTLIWAN